MNLLWRVDGTLFDTYPAITFAISKSLNDLGHAVKLNVIDGLVRHSLNHCVETLSERLDLDEGLLFQHVMDHYQVVPLKNQPPIAGVREVCLHVQELGGKNLIITNRSIPLTESILEAHGMTNLFTDVLGMALDWKPRLNLNFIRAALEMYQVGVDETLFIGNNQFDIQIGKQLGVKTCYFGPPEQTAPANVHIENFNQLLSIIKENNL